MTPPWQINNLPLGRVVMPDADAEESAPSFLSDAHAAVESSEAGNATLLDNSEDLFLREQPIRFGDSTFMPTYRDSTVENTQRQFNQFLASARAGDRTSYYNLLRCSYALLHQLPPEEVPQLLRQMAGIWQEYASTLDTLRDLTTEGRARFLTSEIRAARAFFAYLERETELPGRSEYLPVLRQSLQAMNLQLLGYFDRLDQEIPERSPLFTGVRRMVELHQALLENDQGSARSLAQELQTYLRDHPPPALSEEWYDKAAEYFLSSFPLDTGFMGFFTPSSGEEEAVRYEFESLEVFTRLAFALDAANEESLSTLQTRYRPLIAVLQVLLLNDPAHGIDHWLEVLSQTESSDRIQEILETMRRENEPVHRILEEAGGTLGLGGLIRQAREAVHHVQNIRENYGHHLFQQFFSTYENFHPVLRLARALEERPRGLTTAGISNMGGNFVALALDIYRRGNVGRQILDRIDRGSAVLGSETLLEIFDEELSGHGRVHFQEQFAETCRSLTDEAGEHELSAIDAVAQYLVLAESSDIAHRSAQATLDRLSSVSFSLRQIASHLFSLSNFASMGLGIAAAELLPALALSRAYRGGRLAAPWLSAFFRNGEMRLTGSALTGLFTGGLMSGIGAGIHNAARYSEGLETHFWRDFAVSGVVNSVTFMGMLPFQQLLSRNLLAPSVVGRRLGSTPMMVSGLGHLVPAFAAGTFNYAMNILSRGLATGDYDTSWQEGLETYASLVLWESGAYGFRRWRMRGVLPRELWDNNTWSSNFPILGPRTSLVENTARSLIRIRPDLSPHNDSLCHLLAAEEARFPGAMQRIEAALNKGYFPEFSGRTGRGRLTLVPRRPSGPNPAPAPVPVSPETDRVLRLGDGSTRLAFRVRETDGEAPFLTEIRLDPETLTDSGDFILGRKDFPSPSDETQSNVRIIRRQHFMLRPHPIDPNNLLITDLAGRAINDPLPPDQIDFGVAHGTWVLRGDHWTRLMPGVMEAIPPGTSIALGRISSRKYMMLNPQQQRSQDYLRSTGIVHHNDGDFSQAIVLDYLMPGTLNHPGEGGSPLVQPRPERALEFENLRLGPREIMDLGEAKIIRDGNHSIFRLVGPAELQAEVLRSYDDYAGRIQTITGTDNAIIGEIGERLWINLRNPDGSSREYRFFLDDPTGAASRLPSLDMQFENRVRRFSLRSTTSELKVGRSLDPHFLDTRQISREHFDIRVVASDGNPRYRITTLHSSGLLIRNHPSTPGHFIAQNHSVDIQSGDYYFYFPLDGDFHRHPSAVTNPLAIRFPEIVETLPDWNVTLRPDHDRARPYRPPSEETRLPPPPPGTHEGSTASDIVPVEGTGLLNWFRRKFRF